MKPYGSTHSSPSWIGVYLSILFVFVLVAVLAQLSGCAGMAAATSAGLTQVEADAVATARNIQRGNDDAFKAWQLQAGALTLGAIGRNVAGNPAAVQAALMAAGVGNIGVVGIQNGQVVLTTGQTGGVAAASAAIAPAVPTITPAALNATPVGSILTIPKASP